MNLEQVTHNGALGMAAPVHLSLPKFVRNCIRFMKINLNFNIARTYTNYMYLPSITLPGNMLLTNLTCSSRAPENTRNDSSQMGYILVIV